MGKPVREEPAYLMTMADGTIKQVNPSTGTRVWTVPGRSERPLLRQEVTAGPVSDTDWTHGCPFCSARYLETPPEKARIVGEDGELVANTSAEQLFDTVAEFRVVPNLFEIVSYAYWHENYGFELSPQEAQRKADYLSTDHGRRHVMAVQSAKMRLAGMSAEEISAMDHERIIEQADSFFGGGHDVVISRRHWVDGARSTAELASAGCLSVDEHELYTRLTIFAMKNLYEGNPYVRYVAVFQNWLKEAGASFDHLHKQLVAIDEFGDNVDRVVARVRENANFFNDNGVDYAARRGLLIAENDSAIAYAGFGHRYPTIEIFSKSDHVYPWEHSDREVREMSDLIHAIHRGAGREVPCNEEWHHVPPKVGVPIPWRINIKWRVSTVAGFEGDTKIYINTLSPYEIKQQLVARLLEMRAEGSIAEIRIGDECSDVRNQLRYSSH
ncbi:MAG: DUF4921 family protein [Propionibacteriaceae bacterium]|nr:DUF4921 family protein [Propionibacteriaceae bacterium]